MAVLELENSRFQHTTCYVLGGNYLTFNWFSSFIWQLVEMKEPSPWREHRVWYPSSFLSCGDAGQTGVGGTVSSTGILSFGHVTPCFFLCVFWGSLIVFSCLRSAWSGSQMGIAFIRNSKFSLQWMGDLNHIWF